MLFLFDDIDVFVVLAKEVSEARREIRGGPAQVNASVGWLVPKPYTPFQWAAQPEAEYFHAARRQLTDRLYRGRGKKARKGGVKLKTHNVERSVLEGVFARGDRRLADAIEHAYRAGARFDGWDEHFQSHVWREAFHATGIDPAWYAHRERARSEVLPWAHLNGGAPNEYLSRQYDDVFTQVGMPAPAITAPV